VEQGNGNMVKALRERLGLTQSELARRLRVTAGLVSSVESDNKSFGYATALALRDLCGGEFNPLDIVSVEQRQRIETMALDASNGAA
jgi:transcriptional regulator with XRE-family HTH domain